MELLEQIERFVLDNYIKPARTRGKKSLELVSGEVHNGMKLKNRMPAVCNALRNENLWEVHDVHLIREERRSTVRKDSSTNRFVFDI